MLVKTWSGCLFGLIYLPKKVLLFRIFTFKFVILPLVCLEKHYGFHVQLILSYDFFSYKFTSMCYRVFGEAQCAAIFFRF